MVRSERDSVRLLRHIEKYTWSYLWVFLTAVYLVL